MIIIVGDTHDDILYYDTVLLNKKEDVILNRFKISIGTIFSQKVIVVGDISTSILASSILTHLFDTYDVDLVFVIGKCIAASDSLKHGDIGLSTNVIDTNVDLSIFRDVGMAQIPGFSREFSVQDDIFGYLASNIEKRPNIDYFRTTYLSSDNMSKDMVSFLKENRTIFGKNDERFVIDHNSAGVALACNLHDVPFIVAKVIETGIDNNQTLKTYSKVLSRYIDLGKGVISTINDIGRGDILEGDNDER